MPGYNDIHLLKTTYKHMLLNSSIFTSDAAHSAFVMLTVMANFKIKAETQRSLGAKDPGSLFPESSLIPRKKGPDLSTHIRGPFQTLHQPRPSEETSRCPHPEARPHTGPVPTSKPLHKSPTKGGRDVCILRPTGLTCGIYRCSLSV